MVLVKSVVARRQHRAARRCLSAARVTELVDDVARRDTEQDAAERSHRPSHLHPRGQPAGEENTDAEKQSLHGEYRPPVYCQCSSYYKYYTTRFSFDF